ncbi:DUF4835 family protein [Yeosuana sp. MJ-SS3]|uniref:DUF4835 family protein n=1 Tax=Gilvirhabdus luticola TaxID=3079858 RepID=A0ABU3UAG2_9FLAO|nr:DUF4835 family protein [Yeosuana sp. MJ-SS3]MDU8887306.1 DUF4835 family protein [Yeosuana sp. MJ-SS3]
MRSFLIILFSFFGFLSFSQELNCTVVVDATQTGDENLPIFNTLERQLTEFINNTTWTNKTFATQERIECSMFINISQRSGDAFNATLQVQSSRPVFGSSYSTPIYNFNDRDFTFRYSEYQNMIYNPNQFESNLISVIAFHIQMIFALDADSFSLNGGDQYYRQAQNIVNYSQRDNTKGWKLEDGLQTRYILIDNILSPTFKEFRTVMYEYHREGLDVMSENPKQGKQKIAASLQDFNAMNSRRPNSYLLRTFFDAKGNEIQEIFSSGPSINTATLVETLNKVSPTQASKWRNIK